MTDLETTTLESMCEFVIDCPHFTPEWTNSGFVVIRNQNIRDGRLDLGKPSYTHESDFNRRIARAKPQGGDIIFTREAPMGEVCLLPEGLECCLGQRQVLLRPAKKIDGRYLFYALRSQYVRHQIFWNEGTGSTVSNVRIPVLKALKIPRLGRSERGVGQALGALDDKIDLNGRMNETLEAMVRALFKDWFVDFGPTRAKMEGREPYLAPDLWALFPDRLDDDGKPEGWTWGRFGDVISQRTERVRNREVNVLSALSSGELVNSDDHFNKRVYSKDTSKYLLVERWDVSYNPSRINIGSVGMLKKDLVGGVSPVYVVLRPDPNYRWFLAFSLQMQNTKEWVVTLASGSVRQSLSYAGFASIPCVIPNEAVLQEFDEVWKGSFDKINANLEESQLLSDMRDLLLPKLMSGEIRVREAERMVEDVV